MSIHMGASRYHAFQHSYNISVGFTTMVKQ